MSSVRLSTTSYVVLGSVALRGPSTSYDLKRFVETTLGHFWVFPHSQLYAEPDRLARAGLLTGEREDGGRRRRTYAIPRVELRDLGLLKLFFGELADEQAFQALAHEQVAAHRAMLARYEWLWGRYGSRPEYARRLLPLRAGFGMERAMIAFWEDVASGTPNADVWERPVEQAR